MLNHALLKLVPFVTASATYPTATDVARGLHAEEGGRQGDPLRHTDCGLSGTPQEAPSSRPTHTPREYVMKLDSLHDLYVADLKDLYSAENQLLKALPRMVKAASHPELKAALEEHLEVTQVQVKRLETIFKELGVSPKGKKCVAMEGLIEEGKELIGEDASPAVLDAALIGAAQKVEHYEMAGYGTVRTYAHLLGYEDAADLLQETLDEEGEADKKLTILAGSIINVEAEEEGEDEEKEEEPAPKRGRKK
jgi:ferritin-like metal-binding protein YciE